MIANRMLSCSLLLIGVVAASGQESAPIRVDVSLVNVGFSVRDTKGTLVTNLTQDDFEVFEDGVQQKVSFFARSADVPLSLAILADISGSQDKFMRQHRRDLEWFLKQNLTQRDRAFLVCFGNTVRLVSDLTSSPNQIMDFLEDYEKDRRDFPMLGPRERRLLGTAVYDAMYHSIEKLNDIESGRKALLIMSDGEDNSSAYHMLDVVEAAQSANVLVFAVRYTEVKDGRWNARNKYGVRIFDRITKETGGGHFDARDKELRAHLKQIGEELRSAYELAYHSTHTDRDGTFRKVVVRVKQPGLTARSKTGYYAR
jgi:Ca-activated chloride channel family protein